MEELTKELQKRRAERIARLNTGEATGSELSSVSPSLPEDDRRSLASEGYVHTSQAGESPGEGDGQQQQQQQQQEPDQQQQSPQQQQQPRVKRNKTQIWNEVKINCTLQFVLLRGLEWAWN